jgi:hypothetical protein
MFWHSVVGGVGLLLSWRIWIGIIFYILANLITLGVGGALFAKERTAGAGCFYVMLIRPALTAIFVSIFVVSLFPVMLGAEEAVSPSQILRFLWPISKAGLIAFVIVGLLVLLPIVGDFVGNSVTLQTFLLGVIVFRFLCADFIEFVTKGNQPISHSVYPSLWEWLGYLVLVGVLARLALFSAALVATLADQRGWGGSAQTAGFVVGVVLGVVAGFLPLFMYAQHVRIALSPKLV